jgi:hypothetical protein
MRERARELADDGVREAVGGARWGGVDVAGLRAWIDE